MKMLGHEDLDNRLARNAKATSLFIKRIQHPHGEIHVNTPDLLPAASCFDEIQMFCNILAGVKMSIKFFSFHKQPPLPALRDARK